MTMLFVLLTPVGFCALIIFITSLKSMALIDREYHYPTDQAGYSVLSEEEIVQFVTRQGQKRGRRQGRVYGWASCPNSPWGVQQLFHMYTVGRSTARLWPGLHSSTSPATKGCNANKPTTALKQQSVASFLTNHVLHDYVMLRQLWLIIITDSSVIWTHVYLSGLVQSHPVW